MPLHVLLASLLYLIFAVFNYTFNVTNISYRFCIHLAVKSNMLKILQKLQLLPAVYYIEISHTVDNCSGNQITVVKLYFDCSLTAKVSSALYSNFPPFFPKIYLFYQKRANGGILIKSGTVLAWIRLSKKYVFSKKFTVFIQSC